MIGPLTVRRASRFARAIDADPHAPEQQPAVDEATRNLVAIVDRLRTADFGGAPAPEFKARLRERLVAAAATSPTDVLPKVAPDAGGGPARRRPAGHGVRPARVPLLAGVGAPRAALLAGALSALVALAGVTVVTSHRALPGDKLYSLKRTTESVELALAHGADAKARRHLDFAQNRASELADFVTRRAPGSSRSSQESAAELNDSDVALVRSALDDMDKETREGTRLLTTYAVGKMLDDPLADLAAWAADQRAIIQPVLDRLDGDAAARARSSVALIDQIRQRVAALRAQLTCSCMDRGHGDDLGPLPCWPCHPPTSPQGQAGTNPPRQQSAGGVNPGVTVVRPQPPMTGAATTPQPSQSAATPSGTPARPSTPPASPPSGLPTLPPESGGPTGTGLLPSLLPSGLLPPLLPGVPDLLPRIFGN